MVSQTCKLTTINKHLKFIHFGQLQYCTVPYDKKVDDRKCMFFYNYKEAIMLNFAHKNTVCNHCRMVRYRTKREKKWAITSVGYMYVLLQ